MAKITKRGSVYTDFSMKGRPITETEKQLYQGTFKAAAVRKEWADMDIVVGIQPNKPVTISYLVTNKLVDQSSDDHSLLYDGLSKACTVMEILGQEAQSKKNG